MKIKTFMLLLMLSAGACTVPSHSSGNQDTQQWQQTIQQLNTLLKERKHQAASDEGKQKISELLMFTLIFPFSSTIGMMLSSSI